MNKDEAGTEEKATKKQKKMEDYPMAPNEEWPEAWLMPDGCELAPDFDQCRANQCHPNVAVSAEDMKKLGICYWRMPDVDKYEYPPLQVPYDPKEAGDPKLSALRESRGYSYADIITVHPDTLPEFETKIKAFFEEHIHDAEEIRYILGGSGYFDVRDLEDRWIRVHVKVRHFVVVVSSVLVASSIYSFLNGPMILTERNWFTCTTSTALLNLIRRVT